MEENNEDVDIYLNTFIITIVLISITDHMVTVGIHTFFLFLFHIFFAFNKHLSW